MATHHSSTVSLLLTQEERLVERLWRIVVLRGANAGRVLERSAGTVLIGSHSDADLTLDDQGVSRFHLEASLLPEGVVVKDLESKNGTYIGRRRVETLLIQAGTDVRVGQAKLRFEAVDLPVEVSSLERFGDLVTASPEMKRVLAEMHLVAQSDATVLLEGETGTGKEVAARAIHAASPRQDAPFVVVDCGAVQRGLLTSQLFGHLKGSFTGADADRVGAFERAEGGTVFLDEIGELPLDLQPKLLRALEGRAVTRVGDASPRPIDVRFIAATNRNLEAEAREGSFRRDLYFRLAVIKMRLLPLRERPEDVRLLVQTLGAKVARRPLVLRPEALQMLESYDWPGNVRELRNVLERAALLSRGRPVLPDHLLPDESPEEDFNAARDRVLAAFEERFVRSALARHGGNVSAAARSMGLSRNGLYKVMKRSKISSA